MDASSSAYADLAGVLCNKSLTTLIQCPAGKSGSYTIPNTVTTIGSSAFQSCSNLTSITIPASVTTIGSSAFYYCPNLTSVTLPASVTSLSDSAFAYCYNLTSASFASNAPTMGYGVFSSAANGFKVYYYNGRTGFTSPTWNGYASQGLAAPNIALEQPGGIVMGSGITYDFGTCALGDFTNRLFTIRNTGDLALTGLAITQDGANSGDFTVGAPGATSLAAGATTTFSVTYAPTATGSRVAALHIASNSPDKNPSDINLTGTGTPQPPFTFTFTSSGSAITITGYAGAGGNAAIPATIAGLPVTTIAADAFLNQTLLTGVTIPACVTSIGNSAFVGCGGLGGVYFLGNAPALGTAVFQGDTTALAFYLPAATGWGATLGGLATVPVSYSSTSANGEVTLTGYTGAGGVVPVPAMLNGLPVTRLGGWAFARNGGVTAVIIPYGITAIGDRAFYQCGALAAVTLPTSLTQIGEGAFCGLGGLGGMTSPAGVTSIGANAFADCGGLTAITVDAANPSFSSVNGVLFNKTRTLLIQYPGGKTGACAVPAGVVEIGDWAFYHCGGLTRLTLPAGLLRVGSGAFESCGALTDVVLPAGTLSIGDQAFANCGALASVSLPDSITRIGDQAFASCGVLAGLTLPGSLTSIGQMAFASCGALTSLTIPAGVTDIGSYAFYGGGSLSRASFLGNAPTMGTGVFDANTSDFAVSFHNGATGFSAPAWGGYTAFNADAATPAASWLLTNGLAADADLQSDPNGDGVSLLLAYALNLDPKLNLPGSLPKPVLAGNQLRLSYYAGAAGVSYTVEASADLKIWTTVGVTITAPDGHNVRTATVPVTGGKRFLRLGVAY